MFEMWSVQEFELQESISTKNKILKYRKNHPDAVYYNQTIYLDTSLVVTTNGSN